MSRHIFCYEGINPVNGNGIRPGALTFDEKIPLIPQFGATGGKVNLPHCGYVDDIRREDDGALTGKFHFDNDLFLVPDTWGWTIYATKVFWEGPRKKGIRWVTSAKVRLIYPHADLPWDFREVYSQDKQGL